MDALIIYLLSAVMAPVQKVNQNAQKSPYVQKEKNYVRMEVVCLKV